MGEFSALYKKNFIIWKRNTCGCVCEIVTTLLFSMIFVLIANLSKEITKEDTSYLSEAARIGPDGSLGDSPLAFPDNYLAQLEALAGNPLFQQQIMK
jgi:cell division inhibitor SulA